MVEIVKKTVAIGLAGVTAVVIAAWRQIQRDNSLPDEAAAVPGPPPEPATPMPEASGDGAAVDEKTSKAELYELAQSLGIEGRSKMTKSELLAAIRAAT